MLPPAMKKHPLFLASLLFCLPPLAHADGKLDSIEALGEALFFDQNLSSNRSQSCATCHSPEHAFTDPRHNASARAFSLGADGRSLGDRNTPSAAYARFSPRFHRNRDGHPVGGQFHDGRAADLNEQAGGPPLNPIEMGMPDKASVVARLQENPAYVAAFTQLHGDDVFTDTERAYAAMTQSIAAFEHSKLFAPFDSRYDRHLRGEYQMSPQEELGMTLFFSQQFTNCNLCHQLHPTPQREGETFSNYRYHNIGVPPNLAARAHNGRGPTHVDRGLLEHPRVSDPAHAGQFKVPSLRNVAVTAPYMHNGVFNDLRTVVLFYNKYNSKSAKRQINPETGEPWREPELAQNLSLEELQTGPALDNRRIDALVAFMKTLTDRRYEHLLD